MCESLLLQAPDGSLQPGLATISNPSPTTHGLHAPARGEVLGRPRGHLRRCRLQPGAEHEPQARRVLQPGVQPGQVDPGDQSHAGDDHAEAGRLLAPGRARLDARDRDREELRGEAGQELRHPGRRDHVHRRLHVQVLEAWGRRDRRGEPALLEHQGQVAAGQADPDQGRAGRLRVHLGHADQRAAGLLLAGAAHPGPAEEQQERQGHPGSRLVHGRVHRVQLQGRARQREGAPGAVAGPEPPGHHRLGLQGRRADAASGSRTRARSGTASPCSTPPTPRRRS